MTAPRVNPANRWPAEVQLGGDTGRVLFGRGLRLQRVGFALPFLPQVGMGAPDFLEVRQDAGSSVEQRAERGRSLRIQRRVRCPALSPASDIRGCLRHFRLLCVGASVDGEDLSAAKT